MNPENQKLYRALLLSTLQHCLRAKRLVRVRKICALLSQLQSCG